MIPRLAIAVVALSSCTGENQRAEQREQGRTSVIVAESVAPVSASPDAPADLDLQHQPPKKLEPTRNGICRFEERDPAKRPTGLIPTNHSSNMVFWADRGAMLWDHANGFVDEGMVIKGSRIVAVREGMKDLWIFPASEGDIYLYSGPNIFECRQAAVK